jgi:AcrR family transcriptional regulator
VTTVPDAPSRSPDTEAQTRERLLQAAVRVFDRKGYAAATVREIVELAGVAKPALYYHFGSKQEILEAVVRAGERRFVETLNASVERPGTTRERIIALGEDLYRLFGENLPAFRVVHALFFAPIDAAPAVDFAALDRALVRAIQRIVEDGIAAGEVTPARPLDLAMAITGLLGACAARQIHPGLDTIDRDSLPRILGLVLDGVLRTPTQGESRS